MPGIARAVVVGCDGWSLQRAALWHLQHLWRPTRPGGADTVDGETFRVLEVQATCDDAVVTPATSLHFLAKRNHVVVAIECSDFLCAARDGVVPMSLLRRALHRLLDGLETAPHGDVHVSVVAALGDAVWRVDGVKAAQVDGVLAKIEGKLRGRTDLRPSLERTVRAALFALRYVEDSAATVVVAVDGNGIDLTSKALASGGLADAMRKRGVALHVLRYAPAAGDSVWGLAPNWAAAAAVAERTGGGVVACLAGPLDRDAGHAAVHRLLWRLSPLAIERAPPRPRAGPGAADAEGDFSTAAGDAVFKERVCAYALPGVALRDVVALRAASSLRLRHVKFSTATVTLQWELGTLRYSVDYRPALSEVLADFRRAHQRKPQALELAAESLGRAGGAVAVRVCVVGTAAQVGRATAGAGKRHLVMPLPPHKPFPGRRTTPPQLVKDKSQSPQHVKDRKRPGADADAAKVLASAAVWPTLWEAAAADPEAEDEDFAAALLRLDSMLLASKTSAAAVPPREWRRFFRTVVDFDVGVGDGGAALCRAAEAFGGAARRGVYAHGATAVELRWRASRVVAVRCVGPEAAQLKQALEQAAKKSLATEAESDALRQFGNRLITCRSGVQKGADDEFGTPLDESQQWLRTSTAGRRWSFFESPSAFAVLHSNRLRQGFVVADEHARGCTYVRGSAVHGCLRNDAAQTSQKSMRKVVCEVFGAGVSASDAAAAARAVDEATMRALRALEGAVTEDDGPATCDAVRNCGVTVALSLAVPAELPGDEAPTWGAADGARIRRHSRGAYLLLATQTHVTELCLEDLLRGPDAPGPPRPLTTEAKQFLAALDASHRVAVARAVLKQGSGDVMLALGGCTWVCDFELAGVEAATVTSLLSFAAFFDERVDECLFVKYGLFFGRVEAFSDGETRGVRLHCGAPELTPEVLEAYAKLRRLCRGDLGAAALRLRPPPGDGDHDAAADNAAVAALVDAHESGLHAEDVECFECCIDTVAFGRDADDDVKANLSRVVRGGRAAGGLVLLECAEPRYVAAFGLERYVKTVKPKKDTSNGRGGRGRRQYVVRDDAPQRETRPEEAVAAPLRAKVLVWRVSGDAAAAAKHVRAALSTASRAASQLRLLRELLATREAHELCVPEGGDGMCDQSVSPFSCELLHTRRFDRVDRKQLDAALDSLKVANRTFVYAFGAGDSACYARLLKLPLATELRVFGIPPHSDGALSALVALVAVRADAVKVRQLRLNSQLHAADWPLFEKCARTFALVRVPRAFRLGDDAAWRRCVARAIAGAGGVSVEGLDGVSLFGGDRLVAVEVAFAADEAYFEARLSIRAYDGAETAEALARDLEKAIGAGAHDARIEHCLTRPRALLPALALRETGVQIAKRVF
ncbi:hypothetical protein M885DRAFT_104712 [Pelagophyceae sp. CCMP2097]|nr:hypothetical protein M885DRAFT_104712 [Pelagophyceae sp. CCMP2097]